MNSRVPPIASVVKDNWNTVLAFNRDTQKALNMLASYFLGPGSTPVFGGMSLTSLTLINTINEFSIDGTLGGNSDSVVPTEKAIKTYVSTSLVNFIEDVDALPAEVTIGKIVRLTTDDNLYIGKA